MHVLALPKWYPGRHDPQLGDFIRKQLIAAAGVLKEVGGKISVVVPMQMEGLSAPYEQEQTTADGLWELRCYYRPNTSSFMPLRKLVNLMRWWRACSRGVQRATNEQGMPDLLHVHILVRPALMAWWLKSSKRIPFVISEQSSEYLDGSYARHSGLFHALNRMLFRKASAVSAVSPHLAEALSEHGLCANAEVIGNVIPGTDRPLQKPGDAHRFMMVADLVDRTKNVSGVLRAMHRCRKAGVPVELDVIGGGPDLETLKNTAAELGLNGSVRWHGRLSNAEVLDRMAGTGTVVINSNVETFSVVTGEALALGRPVIATRCGGPQAFVVPANGTLVATQDDEALAAAMRTMVQEHDRYEPSTIRATIVERFSARAVGERFHQLYQQVLHGR